jgi:hypothetical protein
MGAIGVNRRSRPRFWEQLVRDEADDARRVEYCAINPLKRRLVLVI